MWGPRPLPVRVRGGTALAAEAPSRAAADTRHVHDAQPPLTAPQARGSACALRDPSESSTATRCVGRESVPTWRPSTRQGFAPPGRRRPIARRPAQALSGEVGLDAGPLGMGEARPRVCDVRPRRRRRRGGWGLIDGERLGRACDGQCLAAGTQLGEEVADRSGGRLALTEHAERLARRSAPRAGGRRPAGGDHGR